MKFKLFELPLFVVKLFVDVVAIVGVLLCL